MQTELDLAFRPITTFYMHRRLQQSRRLPFEINTAVEEFHEEIHLGRYSQCQELIWWRTHIWEDKKGTQRCTNQSTTASSGLWNYLNSSELHLQHTTNIFLWGYLLNLSCYTHPRLNNCLTQRPKFHQHCGSQRVLKYGKLHFILYPRILQ